MVIVQKYYYYYDDHHHYCLCVCMHKYALRCMHAMAQFWRSETTFGNLFPAFTLGSRDRNQIFREWQLPLLTLPSGPTLFSYFLGI